MTLAPGAGCPLARLFVLASNELLTLATLLPPWALSPLCIMDDIHPSRCNAHSKEGGTSKWAHAVYLFRCFLLVAVFHFCRTRVGVTSDLIPIGSLSFSFCSLGKDLDSFLFSVLVGSSHFHPFCLSVLKHHLPHFHSYSLSLSFLAIFHLKKKASSPRMSPVSSITINTLTLAMDFSFSFAVSLKSWVAILFHQWSEVWWQACNPGTWILPRYLLKKKVILPVLSTSHNFYKDPVNTCEISL